jgi:hypothetical protein
MTRDHERFDHLPTPELIRRKADEEYAPGFYLTLKQIREAPLIQDYRRRPPRPTLPA